MDNQISKINNDSKGILAKLMATENITVEYDSSVNTAAFDVKNRVLIMPVFQGITNSITDLFLGHEVGHALFTPHEQWDKIKKLGQGYHNVVNIVEDVRIEKSIQKKFSGLKKIFYRAYGELLEKNFFGIKDRNVNELGLLDKINIHFKVGIRAGVEFTAEEMQWIDRIENTKTWEEVLELSEELLSYLKEDQQKEDEEQDVLGESENGTASEGDASLNEENTQQEREDNETPANQDDQSVNSTSSDDSNEDSDEQSSQETAEDSDETDESTDGNNDSQGGLGQDADDEILSETQNSFDHHREQITYTDYSDYVSNIVINGKTIERNIDSIVVKNNEFSEIINQIVNTYATAAAKNYNTNYKNKDECIAGYNAMINLAYNKFKNENKSIVNYMIKEFELKKSADEHKRSRVAKTGVINPNKLHSYKFSEDIFIRNTIVSDGKSHGFVMFVDWSSSMGHRIHHALEQVMLLSMFCNKAKIPFDVYSFHSYKKERLINTSSQYGLADSRFFDWDRGWDYKNNEIDFSTGFCLVKLISSTSKVKFDTQLKNLFIIASARRGVNRFQSGISDHDRVFANYIFSGLNSHFTLGNTPLKSTTLIATSLVQNFKKTHKNQITNVVFLTDGQGNDRLEKAHREGGSREVDGYWGAFNINDFRTNASYMVDLNHGGDINKIRAIDDAFLLSLKSIEGVKLINYFITSPKRALWSRELGLSNNHDWGLLEKISKDLRTKGYSTISNRGPYDEYYIIPDDKLNVAEEDNLQIDENMSKAKMRNAFIKHRKNRLMNKKMLSHFVETVS